MIRRQKEILLLGVLIIFALYWSYVPEEPVQEPEITIKYKCQVVLRSPTDIPDHVIKQCKKLLRSDDESEGS
jgi:hypothetical protein